MMEDDADYREAVRMGLRRAGLHWIRASYEAVAGVGALLDELAKARRGETGPQDEDSGDDGPTRIEID